MIKNILEHIKPENLNAAWMLKCAQKEEMVNNKTHRMKFNSNDNERKALTQWLEALKGGDHKEKK
jgi:hypothetical protein